MAADAATAWRCISAGSVSNAVRSSANGRANWSLWPVAVYSLGLLVAAKIAGRGEGSARLPFPRAYPGGLDVALCRKSQRKVGRFHKMTRLTPEPARLPCTRRCGRRRTPPRQYCLYSTAKEGSQVVTVPPASLGDTPAICPLQAYRYGARGYKPGSRTAAGQLRGQQARTQSQEDLPSRTRSQAVITGSGVACSY